MEREGNNPVRPLLQDLSHYLESNGIIQGSDGGSNHATYLKIDEITLAAKLKAEQEYEESIIRRFLDEDKASVPEEKIQLLTISKGKTIQIKTKTCSYQMPLLKMVDQCDVIYSFVHSYHLLRNGKESELEFCLEQFCPNSVYSFLRLLGLDGVIMKVQDIPSGEIIECCRIAHFLQCRNLLDPIVDLIKENVDAENCVSICLLADQLQIPALMNESMSLILDRLDMIQKNDLWNDFPLALKNHVITLRNAASSSIVGGGKQGRVLFTSGKEFLAIFSDIIREHRERLIEAKRRQQEIIDERTDRNKGFVMPCDVHGGDVKDAAIKIAKQEARIRTLEAFYNEQKIIFSRDDDGTYDGSFSL